MMVISKDTWLLHLLPSVKQIFQCEELHVFIKSHWYSYKISKEMKFISNNNCKPVNGTSWKKSLINEFHDGLFLSPVNIDLPVPAQWIFFLSIEFTKPFLLNESAPWASSLQTLPAQRARSMSFQLIRSALFNEPPPGAQSLQIPPCSMSQPPERWT